VKEALLMFVRYPEPGRTKTRLIPGLGAEGASSFYRLMAEHVARIVRDVERPDLIRMAFFTPPARKADVTEWLGAGFEFSPQPEGNLGVKMEAGFARAFAKKAERVVVIGSDCIDITAPLIREAFDSLAFADAILGPATDGGYWLLGLSRVLPEVFKDIPWSSDRTFSATLAALNAAGRNVHLLPELADRNVHLLPELADIDRPEDLESDSVRRLRGQKK
jgi:rSAM/selenodomain-associated transferase 1